MTIRSDQILELEQVQEKLVDVALRECDPAEWVRDTPKERRTRFDQKRSAALTLNLITKLSSILNYLRGGKVPDTPANEVPETDDQGAVASDTEIQAAAKEADELLRAYHKGKRT